MSSKFKIWQFILTMFIIAGCSSSAPNQPVLDMEIAVTNAVATMLAELSPTPEPPTPIIVTGTAEPTATQILSLTPPALPDEFISDLLNPLDNPHGYIANQCEYLNKKWNQGKAEPGTVLIPIMFHSITQGEATQDNAISKQDYKRLMDDLFELGFEAVNMQQAVDFLYENTDIPRLSVLLIVDDRHYREYFDTTFRKYHEEWGWPVVNSWINQDDAIYTQVIQQNVNLSNEGWVDYQSHGYVHNIPMSDNSSDEYLLGELQGSMDKMTRDFGKSPIAIIWPGGGFGLRPAQTAVEVGYKVGFTINPRGPIMFNWVPLADESDPMRPSYLPEGQVGLPLMTLPRYWDTDLRAHLDEIRQISSSAAEFHEANRATELEYYRIVCAPEYGLLGE